MSAWHDGRSTSRTLGTNDQQDIRHAQDRIFGESVDEASELNAEGWVRRWRNHCLNGRNSCWMRIQRALAMEKVAQQRNIEEPRRYRDAGASWTWRQGVGY